MTMTLTCNGDCNHQQQSQCNAHTAMTMAMTCNGDYNHTAMTMTLIMTHSSMKQFALAITILKVTTVCNNAPAPTQCARNVQETFDASAIQTLRYSAFPISTPFRTIIAVQWMSLAHKYSGARGDVANRCELFDVSTIQTIQL